MEVLRIIIGVLGITAAILLGRIALDWIEALVVSRKG
jgi:hypothetical protein